jgi:hypothetical protein
MTGGTASCETERAKRRESVATTIGSSGSIGPEQRALTFARRNQQANSSVQSNCSACGELGSQPMSDGSRLPRGAGR